MSIDAFRESPWSTPHTSYRGSALSLNPAPEYANSEVLVAGLYRTIGLDISEGKVPVKGRELDRDIAQQRNKGTKPGSAALEADVFHDLLRVVLESPKLRNQSTKRFLQVSPLVGETALFSGSARLAGNPWPAGTLTRRMVWLGSADDASARTSWEKLFAALSIERDEDVFARFLTDEIGAWTGEKWGPIGFPAASDVAPMSPADRDNRSYPARQFVGDLESIVAAKPLMTRRQWVSLLESLVRMAAVAHVAWLCEVQKRIWSCIELAIAGAPPPARMADEIYPERFRYLNYGTGAISELKDRTSKYLKARLGINATLWALDGIGKPFRQGLSSAAEIEALCAHIRANRTSLEKVTAIVEEIADRESRTMMCRKGIGANLMEFARHVLYQRIAADDRLRGYDQGYLLRKRGPSKSSQWICAPGPVAVLAAVHCCLSGLSGPRSVHRLAQHLAGYGIGIDHRDIAQNELGHQLR
ncbi:MAG: hypothetical protein ACK4TP_14715, partial [Hyphomicrobium sp.]